MARVQWATVRGWGRLRAAALAAVLAFGALSPAAAVEDVPDLAAVLVPVLPGGAVAPPPPVVAPQGDALARAEKAFDAGRYREALTTLDSGSLPADVGDLVTLRRAELAANLGDLERAKTELARP